MLQRLSQLLLVCLLASSLLGLVAAVSVAEVAERRAGSTVERHSTQLQSAAVSAAAATPTNAVLRPPTIIDGLVNVIQGIRSSLKKEFDAVKTWFKDTWLKAQQMYQYSRYCLNDKAPQKLGLKVPNSALCSTVRKTNKDFANYLERIVTRIPEPSLQQTLKAEMEGEVARALLEVEASNPGDITHKWPKGPIPYSLSPDLDPRASVSFQWGLNHIETVTCVRFQQVKWGTTGGIIRVIPDSTRCSSDLGYKGTGGQSVWWGPQCAAGSAAHELLHALGFDHTMNRLDRDNYVSVNMARIMAGKTHNFVKQKSPFADFGPYDFKSILHYPANAFAKIPANPGLTENKKRPPGTPRALNSPWDGTAQRDALTAGDIAAVKAVYCP